MITPCDTLCSFKIYKHLIYQSNTSEWTNSSRDDFETANVKVEERDKLFYIIK